MTTHATTTFFAILRSEKRKKSAQPKEYRFLSYEECRALSISRRVKALDQEGRIGEVSILSIKTWKTNADLLISWKFGMYEYGKELVTPDKAQSFFVTPLAEEAI